MIATDIIGSSESNWQDLEIWVFGYTHFLTDFERNDVRILSSQRGYVFQGSTGKKYEELARIEFNPKRVSVI